MPVLNVHTNILIHGDGAIATSDPQRRYVDWTTAIRSESVENPLSREYELEPGLASTLFTGQRTLSVDGTTALDLTLNPVKSSVYRMTASGGTAPAFRTARVIALNAEVVTVTVNNNATAEVALTELSARSFASVQVGDVAFVPHTSTGDADNVLNSLNAGYWTVIAKGAVGASANHKVILRRPGGADFEGVSETVTLTADDQIQFFSSTGVQVGDTLEVLAGFSSVSQKAFTVQAVTPSWVEFFSAESLPLEAGILPTSSGLAIYTDANRYLRVSVDQDAIIRLNGDASNSIKLAPRLAGDIDKCAHIELWGTVWRLDVVNRSTSTAMRVNVISAE